MNSDTLYNVKLRKAMLLAFSRPDIELLCADLGLRTDFVGAGSVELECQKIIDECKRNGRAAMERLLFWLRSRRRDRDFPDLPPDNDPWWADNWQPTSAGVPAPFQGKHMSFLDQHPLDFTRPEVLQLRDLFVLVYNRPVAAEELAESAGIAPGTFPLHDNMRTTWTELTKVMALQGKLRTMVEKAVADPAIAAYKQRFQDMLEKQPAIPILVSDSGDDWWKGPDRDGQVARKLNLERLTEKRSRLIDIGIARQVAQVSRSVAKLNLRFEDEKAYGTGFLIQPDLILTNHHNVSHEKYGGIRAMTVEFDYEPGFVGKPLVLQGKVDSIVKNHEHDWAVIQLEHMVNRQPIALGTPYDIGKNDPVVIIQHPLGAFKQFALDPMSIQYIDEEVVQYLADTQDGSSGSPVFNIKMHLIALHHAEAEVVVDVDGREEIVWRNEGVRIDRIMEDLQACGIEFVSNKP
jgi:V8-like Glu-specific endopeptidase